MRNLSLIILVVALGLSACKKDEVFTGYDESYSAWQSFKKSSSNSYSYVTYNGSWTGLYAESKITVQNGKVIARDFLQGHYLQNTATLIVDTTWAENAATLNTHEYGFEALTLDQVYTKAKTEWLNVSKEDNYISFEAANNGIVSSAGFVPKGCQDDCFNGINIKDIKVYVKPI